MSTRPPVDAVARRYVDALEETDDGAILAAGRARFAERVHGITAPAPRRWLLVPALAVPAAALAVLAVALWPEPPLSVVVRGQPDSPVELVETDAMAAALDFSDGSEVVVQPASQMKVQDVTSRGAAVKLIRGAARVSVVHRSEKTRWQFTAGPYRVNVVGTRFELRWNPDSYGLEVEMDDGIVEVDGPGLVKQRVTSRQTLEAFADPPRASLYLGPKPVEPPREVSSSGPPPAPEPGMTVAPRERERRRIAPPRGGPSWRYLADTGDARGALAAAEEAGFATLVNSMPKADVLLLADTALEAGKPRRAKEAWLAVRERFAGTDTAVEAAIRLGRVTYEVEKKVDDAEKYFELAIQEAPNAPSAPVALGAWLEVLHDSGRTVQARRMAASYVKKYPNGPSVRLAREVLRGK